MQGEYLLDALASMVDENGDGTLTLNELHSALEKARTRLHARTRVHACARARAHARDVTRRAATRHGTAWHGTTRCDTARHGTTRHETTRPDPTRHDAPTTRLGNEMRHGTAQRGSAA